MIAVDRSPAGPGASRSAREGGGRGGDPAVRRMLVLSPHFPPSNTADMQRVRISLPHYRECGWQPTVLAVDPARVEAPQDRLLLETIPADVPVHRVEAIPVARTRRVGVGSLALRAYAYLARAGDRLLARGDIDLVYISTTAFPVMALGRRWKRRFGVPFVLDMQDPWLSVYHEERPGLPRPPKYRLSRLLHGVLEPITMARVDGLIAVSGDYIRMLVERYPRVAELPTVVLPFGASSGDQDVLRRHPQPNPFFRPGDGSLHGVYVGRGGADMARALRIVFGALRDGIGTSSAFDRVRLHFIGTDYAPPDRVRRTILPVAEEAGVADRVREHPVRVPYFQALQALRDADFLIVPGSDDPHYTASKLYPYILSRRPLVGVFHERSGVVATLRDTGAGEIVAFRDPARDGERVRELRDVWTRMLARLPFEPATDWARFEPFTARAMTRRQCELFDRVVARARA